MVKRWVTLDCSAFMRMTVAGLGLMALTGCGGSTAVVPPQTFDAEAKSFLDNDALLESLFNTSTKAMPVTGSATYNGQSGLVLTSAAGEDFLLLGDARMLADFSTGTMAGTLGSFRGVILPPGSGPASAAVDYSGVILLQNGAIGVVRANDFDADFGGTLTGGGNVIVVAGDIYGDFKGTPIRGIRGSSSAGGLLAPTGTINGLTASQIALGFWTK